jgi:hypothetical protein
MVALERSLRELGASCRTLAARLGELRVTVVEDRPDANDLALIAHRRQTIEDLVGDLTEASNAIAEGRTAADGSDDHGVSRAIVAAHETLLRLAVRFATGVGGYEQLAELLALGRNRGRAWSSWSHTVRRAVEDCRQALQATEGGILECWRDLAERRDYRRARARREPTPELAETRHQEQGIPTLTLFGKEGEGRHGTE